VFALCAWCVCAVGTVCVKCTGVRDAMATACMCVQRGGHGGCARSACVVREGRTWELVSAERTGAARGERDVSLVRVARDHAGDHAGVARSAMTEAGVTPLVFSTFFKHAINIKWHVKPSPNFSITAKLKFSLNTPKSQLSHFCSNELLPKTKVIEFDKINNFRVQSFSSSNMKI